MASNINRFKPKSTTSNGSMSLDPSRKAALMQLMRQNQHLMQLLLHRQVMQQPMSWTMGIHSPQSSKSGNFWIFNYGCFNHMSPYPAGFITKQPSQHPTVRTADLTPKPVLFSGHFSNDTIQLPDVLHVPGLAIALVYLTQLQEMGLLISFDFSGCVIQDPKTKQILGKGHRVGRVLEVVYLRLPLSSSYTNLTASVSKSPSLDLWHARLGHLSSARVQLLANSGLLGNITSNEVSCLSCKLGKHHALPFELNDYKSASVFELIHSDVWGPTPHPSMGGCRYFVIFVDDHTPAFTAVYTINRHPTPTLQNKSLYEALHGITPAYELLKLQPHEHTKLQPRSRLCLFLGYGIEHKGYRCWDPISKRLRISRHVTFWEHVPFYTMPNSHFETPTSIVPFFTDSSISLDLPYSTFTPNPEAPAPVASPTQSIPPPVPIASPTPEAPAHVPIPPPTQSSVPTSRSTSEPSVESADPGPSSSENVRQVPSYLREYHCYATLLSNHEPTSYKEASSSSHWQAAMQEELHALDKAQTWDSVPLPPGKRPIGSKWVFKIKTKSDGSIDRYKARLVAKGFNQEYGIDYEETLAPVARITSVRSLLAIAATKRWPLFQMDIKNSFLNGDLPEEVYMNPPPGVSLPAGHMKDLGKLHYFLGLEVLSDSRGTYLCRDKYTSDLLSRAGITNQKVVSTPLEPNLHLTPNAGPPLKDPTLYRQLVGSLVYLTVTRPDIAYAVHTVSQFMSAPCSDHYVAVLRILRYLKGTIFHGLYFCSTSSLILQGFSYADWDSDMTDRRSTTGFCFFLGDSLISWRSKKQSLTARSSTEAEYCALADTSQELIWLRWLLSDMALLWCDNTSAIQIAHNDVFHERTKHIEIDCHFVRQYVVRKTIQLQSISTDDQPADIFTKAHLPGHFRELVSKLNLALVRFLALHRIKPQAPSLVWAPVNSFEFHSCERTPRRPGYLMLGITGD
ncbi:hypothetical protein OSB04_019148 [Centaurea solstitialis]|uniref:Uncharacterized protein n=1 Tax=Centaurea solstitialis TaxID=347529 RepID=A0AA38WC40_9ASTR|nr:hypothetical protein OSB04_019148 [Centaurea solstitialis]